MGVVTQAGRPGPVCHIRTTIHRLLTSVDGDAINSGLGCRVLIVWSFGGFLSPRKSIRCMALGFTRPAGEFAERSGRKPSRRTPASEPRITTFEKRGAMPDRKSLVFLLWVTSSLALLASVLVAPIRTSGFVSVSFRPFCVRRNFAVPPGQPTTRLSAAMAVDGVSQVNALPSENEEQDRADPLQEPRVSFLVPSSFRNVPDRQLIAPRSILSLYPLRC